MLHQTDSIVTTDPAHLSQKLISVKVTDFLLFLQLFTLFGHDECVSHLFVFDEIFFSADQFDGIAGELPFLHILCFPELLFLFIQDLFLIFEPPALGFTELKQISQGLMFLVVIAHGLFPVDFYHFTCVLKGLRLAQEDFPEFFEQFRLCRHTNLLVQFAQGLKVLC